MRPLILAMTLWLALLTPALAQPPRLPKGDLPPVSVKPINLDDLPDGYGQYKCVITNDVVAERLDYFVIDLGWGVDATRRFIYAFIYCESRLDPYASSANSAQGVLQQRQIAIDQYAILTGEKSFDARELSKWELGPNKTYLRALSVLNAMARKDKWKTRERVWNKWLGGHDAACNNEYDCLQYVENLLVTEREITRLEREGIACIFHCNTAPWKTIP